MRLRRYLSCLFCCLMAGSLSAQYMSGYRPDHYSGLQALYRQPAALAGMSLKLDVQLGGFDVFGWNDYLGLRRPFLFQDSLRQWRKRRPGLVPEALDGSRKSFFLGGDLHLPGVAFRINDSLGLALSARIRSLTSFSGVGEPLARMLYYNGERPELLGQSFDNDGLRFLTASFLEVGLGGGATLLRRGPHRLKVGLTLKLSFAMAGAQLYAERLQYQFLSSDSLLIEAIDAQVANGLGDSVFRGNRPLALPASILPGAPGWGLDVGLLYEYGGEPGLPYRWRIGLALNDLGELSIPRSGDLAALTGSGVAFDLGRVGPGVNYDSVALAEFATQKDREAFTLLPPLALTLHGDIRLRPRWHLGWTARTGLHAADRPNAFRPPGQLIITPRWQRKWLGAGLPITIDQSNQFAMGLVMRLGPLSVGSGNMLGLFLTDNIRSGDVFATLHLPIPYQGDPPPPAEEEEPQTPTPPIAKVDSPLLPPDTSLTEGKPAKPEPAALTNSEIEPVDEPTSPALAETPEPPRVAAEPVVVAPADSSNQTPTPKEPEPAQSEPTVATAPTPVEEPPKPQPELSPTPKEAPEASTAPLTEAQIAAIEQAEAEARRKAREERAQAAQSQPTTPRPRRQRDLGQPFADTVKTDYNSGPLAQYFPYADADEDGVPNRDDACPDKPGLKDRRGCPEDDPRGLPASARAPEGLEIDAFERVYFKAGEAYLNGKARIALNRVVNFLRDHPDVSLRIVGHADATGGTSRNDRLSERRCKAVRQYLIGKDLAPERLVIEAYGERMPAASNATEAGRQRNRRVALVLFDPN